MWTYKTLFIVIAACAGTSTFANAFTSDIDLISREPNNGPFKCSTPPGCGDAFLDPGGLLNYSNNTDVTQTICSTVSSEVVSFSFGAGFQLSAGDALFIYNGTDTSWPLLTSLSGLKVFGAGPFEATNATGCLTLHFRSDSILPGLGYSGQVSCGPPSACFQVAGLQIVNILPDADGPDKSRFTATWASMFKAHFYEVELWDAVAGSILMSDTTSQNTHTFTQLDESICLPKPNRPRPAHSGHKTRRSEPRQGATFYPGGGYHPTFRRKHPVFPRLLQHPTRFRERSVYRSAVFLSI